jgi:transcriptional regulator with XRE-family HTH domain
MNKETKTARQHHAPYITFKLAIAGKGLTLRDVAAAIDVTESTLSQKINGASDFYLSEIRKICDTFGFDKSIFFAESVA